MTKNKVLYVYQGDSLSGRESARDPSNPNALIYIQPLQREFEVELSSDLVSTLDMLSNTIYNGIVVGNLRISKEKDGKRNFGNGINLVKKIKEKSDIPIIVWVPEDMEVVKEKFSQ